jgi:GxxExxY protein
MALMTATQPDQARAGHRRQLIEAELTERIIGAFYRVYNRLGYGFLEAVYSRALANELVRTGLRIRREVMVDVFDEGLNVGRYRADILVESRIVVENKATSTLTRADRDQLLNYLRCSCLEVGLLFHFGPRPAFKRVVAENARSPDPVISKSPATIVVPTDPGELGSTR